MAEFTNLSSMKVAGSVETTYQGKLIGTFANEDALPTASTALNGFVVYLADVKEYRKCNGTDWNTVIGDMVLGADISKEIDADVKVVSDALSKAQTDINKTISDLADRHDSEMTAIENRATELESDVAGNTALINSVQGIAEGKQDPISAGSGLALSGTTINHANTITASSKGSSTEIPVITVDSTGHVTALSGVAVTVPTKTSQLSNDSDFATNASVNEKISGVYKLKGSTSALPSNPANGDVYNLTVAKDGYPAGTNWVYVSETASWDALSGIVTGYATESALNSHIGDTTKHITDAERTKWNKVVSDVEGLEIPNVSAFQTHIDTPDIHVTASEKSTWTNKQDTISATAPIEFDADTNKVSHKTSGVTAGTYGSTSVVPKVSVDATGHVTKVENQTITPASIGALPTDGKAADATKADYATSAGSANTATTAGSATNATNATNDGAGNKIVDTYATKTELNNGLSGKQNTLTFDSAPTSGSTNPVTSGGVFSAINSKMDDTPVDEAPTSGSANLVTSGGVYDAINTKHVVVSNVTASSWVEDTTYSDYGYRCALSVTGVTASDVAEVIFGVAEATSGDYAPVCQTYAGGVYIYSKVNTSITVPTVMVVRA